MSTFVATVCIFHLHGMAVATHAVKQRQLTCFAFSNG